MLSVEKLRVLYGKAVAVDSLSVQVDPGKVTIVLGANGAGKSTTLRGIAGLQRPRSGTVQLEGRDITGAPPHAVARMGVSLVPEGRRIFGALTVEENLRLGAYATPKNLWRESLAQVYATFPILSDRRHSAAGFLSGGEQQMLAFGRAAISRPRVMLMDEPSMGLAPSAVETVMAQVRSIADSGIAVLLVEQNARMGLQIADDVVLMARGSVVYSGSASEVADDSALVRTFLGGNPEGG